MQRRATVPFFLKRSKDVLSAMDYTSTRETVHGLLSLDGDVVSVQWRRTRRTERVRTLSMTTDEEMEAVREVVVPLADVAGAVVRRQWWRPWSSSVLVLRAADLGAFEEVAGAGGLALAHPSELVLRLRRADHLTAEEFAAELALALAERTLPGGDGDPPALPSPRPDATAADGGPRPGADRG